ncbi:TPA: ANR family transcriptional regulator [Vibrio cholerae]
MKKAPSEYRPFAEHARELERAGFLKDAAFGWQAAAEKAREPINRRWAQARADWCLRWSSRSSQWSPQAA